MKIILIGMYVIYILVTLLQIGTILWQDIKHDRVDLYTLLFNIFMVVVLVALNYDFGVLVRYFGVSFKSLLGMLALAVGTWAAYAQYPIIRRNPFWKKTF